VAHGEIGPPENAAKYHCLWRNKAIPRPAAVDKRRSHRAPIESDRRPKCCENAALPTAWCPLGLTAWHTGPMPTPSTAVHSVPNCAGWRWRQRTSRGWPAINPRGFPYATRRRWETA